MELEEIIKAIKQWDASRDDAPKMDALFKEGNCFRFKVPDDIALDDEEFIHAYVSVIKNGTSDLATMLLIESNKDNKEQDRIHEHVKKIAIAYELIPKEDIVDPKKAKIRIKNWEDRGDWFQKRLDAKKEIHQVFVIPKRYLKPNVEYQAFFALNNEVGTPSDETALIGDMIVWDKTNSTITYPNTDDTADTFYNTIRLAPPFRREKDENNFYLLKLAMNKI